MQIPKKNDAMSDILKVFCQYCGDFKFSGYSKYFENTKQEIMSKTWVNAYANYKKNKPVLSKY